MLNSILFFAVGIAIEALLIKVLCRLAVYKSIYALGPQTHLAKKQVPSFGGVGIPLIFWLGVLVFQLFDPRVIWLGALFSLFAVIGFVDDWVGLVRKRGIKAREKFALQVLAAVALLLVFSVCIHPLSVLEIGGWSFVIVGASNATNLSDGLDGLLGGLSLMTTLGFVLVFLGLKDRILAESGFVLIVGLLSFLAFNLHPARIFMGDTGSLALGAIFAGYAVLLNRPLILIPLGAVYILETLSVMIQVAYFKRTGKRIFLMSPLHHHFELLGLSELKTVFLFWGIGLASLMIFLAVGLR